MTLITEKQLDALQEFINIGIGRAAGMLNEMLDTPIQLCVPMLQMFEGAALKQKLAQRLDPHHFSAVRLGFSGSFSGSAELLFPTESASALVALLTGEDRDSPDLDGVKIGTLTEVGNIVINGILGSISNLLSEHMSYALPSYHEDTMERLLLSNHLFKVDTIFLLAQARFEIKQLEIVGEIILIFEMTSFSELLACIDRELALISQSSEKGAV
ncbi:chemotaxis protein CheC [Leptolyngbya boryana CZ1]|uniref:Chemotaxis protein CheC n=1 Tax=Leptolyngbya boryana CZ1 TaxID=3060204 RepID=A0AA96WWN9_LEPBY|nr:MULTISPECIES: chemotaxis protein CheC [Leptolyngbya]MBN8563247.1 chemotaxis protein CheC [Leptolyngbya sp. UWPOB_LEPTO1]WNZ47160.1 chemotaxis protein CheC [Leptolyngbya boryana CZ1]